MQTKTYGGATLAYTISGPGGTNKPSRPDLLLLHGWGVDHTTLEFIIGDLAKDHKVAAIDFPGFGESPEPSEPWNNRRFSELVEDFISAEKLEKPVLVCHSFGGRVALDLAARRPDLVGGLVLMGSAGVRPKRSKTYYLKLYSYKAIRGLSKVPGFSWLLSDFIEQYRVKYGSSDYKKASEVMRKTLSSVVDEDLTGVMGGIKAPTLLIWGEKDTATPVEHGRVMESLIPGAKAPGGGLIVYEGLGHYAFLQKAPETLKAIRHFLGQEVTHA